MTTLKFQDRVTMAFLVALGATAMGTPSDVKRREFEDKFGVRITDDSVVRVIQHVARELDGSEEVKGDGWNQDGWVGN